eukprot:CAMPEP_0204830988 /NCGR_PEP_ID=MMETSP1346-20131115/9589_1 /ASSEMBLY_ACC=CAM_ASM_000771 /TAXON_ID=215587 /ORGANISM="Aplanochytrium stocchinoi, Strain GSBS06" /LENGTH=494 /DNA_ID=CAMNT_0051961641 /DNA_START=270 /DNA_END=1751 /DNA_ORIENTATION=-
MLSDKNSKRPIERTGSVEEVKALKPIGNTGSEHLVQDSGTTCEGFEKERSASEIAGEAVAGHPKTIKSHDEKGSPVLHKYIYLKKGIKRRNFWTFLAVALTTIMFLVFLNSMQAFLLTNIYEVDTNDLGTVTGYLGLADELLSIATLGLWGVVSDVCGRQAVIITGYFLIMVGCFLMPNGQSVFPAVLFFRLIYATGASALSSIITALLSDYVVKADIGKGSGMFGLAAGFGAVISVFFLVGAIPSLICISNTYYLAAAISVLMIIASAGGLQTFSNFKASDDYAKPENVDNLFVLFCDGMKAARNKLIALAYMSALVSRGESVAISVFISLWVNRYYIEENMCNVTGTNGTFVQLDACNENLVNDEKYSCTDAFSRFAALSGTAQVAALTFAPVFGFLGDKFDPVKVVAGCSLLGTVSFALVGIISDPRDNIAFFVLMLWGISQIGMVVSSQFLIAKIMPNDIRGTVSGCFSIMGALGVIIYTYVGGVLFDEW